MIDLGENLPRKKMRKGHAYEIRRGNEAGLVLRRSSNPRDCDRHLELLEASIERRSRRGEQLTNIDRVQSVSYSAMLESGAAANSSGVVQERSDENVVAGDRNRPAEKGTCLRRRFLVYRRRTWS